MRIIEEPVRQQNPFTSNAAAIAMKLKEQAIIDKQRAEFLKRGGKQKVIEGPKPAPKKTYSQKVFDEARKRAQKVIVQHAPCRYIRISKTGRNPQVFILKKYVGTYKTIAEAKAGRNAKLIELGMQPIDD